MFADLPTGPISLATFCNAISAALKMDGEELSASRIKVMVQDICDQHAKAKAKYPEFEVPDLESTNFVPWLVSMLYPTLLPMIGHELGLSVPEGQDPLTWYPHELQRTRHMVEEWHRAVDYLRAAYRNSVAGEEADFKRQVGMLMMMSGESVEQATARTYAANKRLKRVTLL